MSYRFPNQHMSDADLKLLYPGMELVDALRMAKAALKRGTDASHQGALLNMFFSTPKVVKEQGPDCASRTAVWKKKMITTPPVNNVFKLGAL